MPIWYAKVKVSENPSIMSKLVVYINILEFGTISISRWPPKLICFYHKLKEDKISSQKTIFIFSGTIWWIKCVRHSHFWGRAKGIKNTCVNLLNAII